ncbi:unnamed protein product [Callosobruchus maculatus]|uniref:Uncharacterized protein n=1 Tax=Callosobruchus maculatus TaxID=64391 RepID=A0A653CXY1_CALMS|nr:unnamed protein product [Callosobruchus maculatus]
MNILFLLLGDLSRPIFDRDDVVVNSEEQITEQNRLERLGRNRSASRSSSSPECNRRDDRKKKAKEERSERTPLQDSLRKRSRSSSADERCKRRWFSRDYRRRSRSKSDPRELLDSPRPSCSMRRSQSPRWSTKISFRDRSRSPVIRKRSSSPQRRSRSRTPRRSDPKYRHRREERRSWSPLYHRMENTIMPYSFNRSLEGHLTSI